MRLSKRYILELEGETITAVITTDGDQVAMQVNDNASVPVDACRVLGGRAWSLRLHNRQFLVHLTPLDDKGSVAATLGGRPLKLTVLDEMHAMALRESDPHDRGGILVADMPGLVVNVMVVVGQKVTRHEPVIIVEAMKMQNELGAGIDGTVLEIPVTEGQPVNPGDPLVVIAPDQD